MLNYIEIAQRIKNPSKIQQEDIQDLKDLIGKFPHSSLFPFLYLKSLALYDKIQFDTELENYAYAVPDRTQLFFMMNESEESKENKILSSLESEVVNTEETVLEEAEDVEIEEGKSMSNENPLEIENITEKVEERDDSESDKEETEEYPLEKELDDDNLQKETEETEIQDQSAEDIELEKNILSHAVSSSIFLEIEDEEIDFSELRRLDRRKDDIPEVEELEDEAPPFDLTTHPFVKEEKESKNKEDLHTEKSFTDWLLSTKGKQDKEVDIVHIQEEDREEKILNEQAAEKDKKVNLHKIKEKKEPFKRKKEAFFSPEQKARESLDESRLPVSETLAKIYANQGNYPKAIQSYNKLMLKFPKKKSYFALQIEILKNKL